MTLQPHIRPFDKLKRYEQEENGDATFHWVLEKDEIPDSCMGLVSLKGPIHKKAATHDEFDQVYLIFLGSATIHMGDNDCEVTGPAAVIIPAGTYHSVELSDAQTLDYVFVNRWRKG